MAKNISLFSGYDQKENRTTNYCLLILKMIYEESPKLFSEVMSTLLEEDLGDLIGVNFKQQQRRKESVPDGFILQNPFSIYIETKNYDWFYGSQLQAHLKALNAENPGIKILIALANFQSTSPGKFDEIREICKNKYNGLIRFFSISFEDLIGALQQTPLPKDLQDMVSDLEDFFDEQGLLSNWENFLDVVSCSRTAEEVISGRAYICPASGGSYNHNRCKYFGVYRNKRVEKVGIIEAVVDIESQDSAKIKWKNIDIKDSDLEKTAVGKIKSRHSNEFPKRVFLLGELFDTEFIKDSKGGMWVSKNYFDIGNLKVSNSKELADRLKGKTWSMLKFSGASLATV